jgi:alpha-1,4-digalacturonate transport system substrate-binding protein
LASGRRDVERAAGLGLWSGGPRANEEFKNAQVVLYLSGSCQIAQFDKTIGNAFDWIAIAAPCGPADCTGMPGGAGLIAVKATKNPHAVATVMDYLASEPMLSEFYSRFLFIPGHIGLAQKGLEYQTVSPAAKAALAVFSTQVATLSPIARQHQGYVNNRIIFNAVISWLGQAISGETGLEETYKRIQSGVEQQIAERHYLLAMTMVTLILLPSFSCSYSASFATGIANTGMK